MAINTISRKELPSYHALKGASSHFSKEADDYYAKRLADLDFPKDKKFEDSVAESLYKSQKESSKKVFLPLLPNLSLK